MARRTNVLLAAALAAGGILGACGSDTTGSGLPNLVGVWTITKFEFVRVANPSTKVDLIALGGSGHVTFNSNGTWATTLTFPGLAPLTSSGTYTETATSLTLVDTSQSPSETSTFAMTVSGNVRTATGGTATFDFGSGDEAATLNVTATK